MGGRRNRRLSVLLWTATIALTAATLWRYVRDNRPGEGAVALPLDTGALQAEHIALDINTATAAELQALPGIGPALAENIAAWREMNGPFTGPEDVMAVQGIGEAIYEMIAPYIKFK